MRKSPPFSLRGDGSPIKSPLPHPNIVLLGRPTPHVVGFMPSPERGMVVVSRNFKKTLHFYVGLSVGRSVCTGMFSKTTNFRGLTMCPSPPHVGSKGGQWGVIWIESTVIQGKNRFYLDFWAFFNGFYRKGAKIGYF